MPMKNRKLDKAESFGFVAGSSSRLARPERSEAIRRERRVTLGLMLTAGLSFTLGLLSAVKALAQNPPAEEPWKAPARAARKENPIPADPKSVGQGKELFVMGCLPCHGAAGKGDGPAAATLERNGVRVRPGNLSLPEMWQQSDGEMFWKISEGRTPMPTWKESLNEEQRWLIVNYVRTLAPRPVSTNQTSTTQITTK